MNRGSRTNSYANKNGDRFPQTGSEFRRKRRLRKLLKRYPNMSSGEAEYHTITGKSYAAFCRYIGIEE